jgi:predicted ArsR family transcriptional regulator
MAADQPQDHEADLHRLLAVPSRRRILETLCADGPSDIDHLTTTIGLHPTTVRFHLQQLSNAGLVTSATEVRASRGRPRGVYTAVTIANRAARADAYQALAEALVSSTAASADGTRTAINAGRMWGRREADDLGDGDGREQLVTLMTRLGFVPKVTSDSTVALTSCPLIDVARDHPDVVCSLHLGVLQGALDALGTMQAVAGLQPFAAPGRCLVTLARRDSIR